MKGAGDNDGRASDRRLQVGVNEGRGFLIGDGNTQYNLFGGELGFCSCGNRIQSQCQLCRNGLCKECDVIDFPKPPPASSPWIAQEAARRLIVPVQGFGYAEASRREDAYWAVAGGRIARLRPVNAGFIGPLLRVQDILPHLGLSSEDTRHLCCGCLIFGQPKTVEAIYGGKQCEYPACGAAPGHHCPCCREAFCGEHGGYHSGEFCKMCTIERREGFGSGIESGSRQVRKKWVKKKGEGAKAQIGSSDCGRDRCFDNMVDGLAESTASGASARSIHSFKSYDSSFAMNKASGAGRRYDGKYPVGYYKLIGRRD